MSYVHIMPAISSRIAIAVADDQLRAARDPRAALRVSLPPPLRPMTAEVDA